MKTRKCFISMLLAFMLCITGVLGSVSAEAIEIVDVEDPNNNKTIYIMHSGNTKITFPSSTYTYTQSAIKPKPTVKYTGGTLNNVTLTENKDYTVTYSNNVDVGTATVMVTGIAPYYHSVKTTFTIAPPNVSGLKTTSVSESAVDLSWNKAAVSDGYIVYKYDNTKKTWVRVVKTTTTADTYTVSDLSPATSYKFAVKAYKTVDGKEVTSASFPQVSANTVLATVSGFKVSSTSTSGVKLTWNKVSGAQGYIVYKYDNTKKTWVRVAKTATTDNVYTVSGLSPATAYKFAVKAYKTVSGKEVTSASFPQVSTNTVLATVSGFKVSSTSTSAVKLTWNKVSGAQGYIVYKYDNTKKTWVRVAKTTTAANTYTVSKLSAGTTYKFAVKAYKTVSGKEVTSASFPQLTTSTNPATVSFTLTAGSGKATVKWSKVTGATGYIVYYKTSANGSWQRLNVTTGTSYTKSGLTKGKTYYFTVKAYRTVDGKTYNGGFTSKSVKVK